MSMRKHPIAGNLGDPLLARLAIDADLIERLRASYAVARDSDRCFAKEFYERLFAAAPAVRGMFKSDPDTQRAKLTAMFDAIIANLETPETNAEMLRAMGLRHSAYGAKPEHYELVASLLADTIVELSAGAETERLRDDWMLAMRLIAHQMMSADTPPGTKH